MTSTEREDSAQTEMGEAESDHQQWHTMLREAIITLRRTGGFGYESVLGEAFYCVLLFFLFQEIAGTWWKLTTLASIILIAICLLLVEQGRIRKCLAGSDLIDRFLCRDPALKEQGITFGQINDEDSTSTGQVLSDIKIACGRLPGLLDAARVGLRQKYRKVLLGASGLIFLSGLSIYLSRGVLGIDDSHWVFAIYGSLLALTVGISFLNEAGRKLIWTREFCSQLSLRLGSDLVKTRSELALGLPAFADKLERLISSMRVSLVLVVVGTGIVCFLVAMFSIALDEGVGTLAILACVAMLVALVWEMRDDSPALKAALASSGIALKLFSGEYTPELFSPATNWKVTLWMPQLPRESVIRTALLLALESDRYVNLPPRATSRWLVPLGGTLAALAIAIYSSLAAIEPRLSTMLYLPVIVALLVHWGLSGMIAIQRRMISILHYLVVETQDQR